MNTFLVLRQHDAQRLFLAISHIARALLYLCNVNGDK